MWKPSSAAGRPSGHLRWRAPGITLLELLVALAILSLVLTLAYGSFFQISGAATQLKTELEEQQELRLILKMIADDMQSAQYLTTLTTRPVANGGPSPSGIVAKVRYVGKGEFSYISLHAATQSRFYRQRPPELDPGLHEVGYGVEEDTTTHTLNLVRRENYYLDSDMLSGGVSVIISHKLETFSLAFLDPPDSPGSTTERWEREWDSSQRPDGARLPRAVRISLGLVGKDGHPVRESIDVNIPGPQKVGQ